MINKEEGSNIMMEKEFLDFFNFGFKVYLDLAYLI